MFFRLLFLPFKMFFALLLILSLILGWHLFTGGFSYSKISTPPYVEGSLYADARPSANVKEILKQPFTYLDKGNQAYVFESKDGEYVLKIIRQHKYKTPFWARLFPNTEKTKNTLIHKSKNWKESLLSYAAAAKELKKPSQTIYTHLQHTHNYKNKKVVISDHLGRKWELDLDDHFYIIQKKADTTLSKALLKMKASNDLNGANKIISSLRDILNTMDERGYYLRAKNCFKNLGVKASDVQIIDLGGLRPLDSDGRHPDKQSLFSSYQHHLVKWSKKNFPELVSIIEENLKTPEENDNSKDQLK